MHESMYGRIREQAQARLGLVILIFLVMALVGSLLWYWRTPEGTLEANSKDNRAEYSELTSSTRQILNSLNSLIEIRFYSVLDTANLPDSLQSFSQRVDQLLSKYQQEANGNIKVIRYNGMSDSNAVAASSDGMKPFNLNKGDACFLGLTVARDEQKEILPQLFPEWEQALEFDLSRAIQRVAKAKMQANSFTKLVQANPASTEELKRRIPQLETLSLEEATQMLREAAMEDLKAAVKEMEFQVQETQQRLAEAQQDQSEVKQQNALKQIQQVQAEQTRRVNRIASQLQAQIAALEDLKGASKPPAQSGK